jgi:hypothetical protein
MWEIDADRIKNGAKSVIVWKTLNICVWFHVYFLKLLDLVFHYFVCTKDCVTQNFLSEVFLILRNTLLFVFHNFTIYINDLKEFHFWNNLVSRFTDLQMLFLPTGKVSVKLPRSPNLCTTKFEDLILNYRILPVLLNNWFSMLKILFNCYWKHSRWY